MNKLLSVTAIVFATVFVVCFSYFMWQLGRKINYSLSYEDMVKRTVVEMVKKEALK